MLRRTAAEWGTGVLLAEQSAQRALEAADRACVLRRGQIVLEGAPVDIANRPGVLESTYLGEMDWAEQLKGYLAAKRPNWYEIGVAKPT